MLTRLATGRPCSRPASRSNSAAGPVSIIQGSAGTAQSLFRPTVLNPTNGASRMLTRLVQRVVSIAVFSAMLASTSAAQTPDEADTNDSTNDQQVQSAPESIIDPHTVLSSALPPGEWGRVESAVDRGLKWLADNQEMDGRFPSTDVAQPAVTSFGIMAFLSRGHLPDQGPYGRTITRAIDFVMKTQRRPGYFSLLPIVDSGEHGSPGQAVNYNHSIAGLMLGEVYGMTSGERSAQIENSIRRALVYHREVQMRSKKHASDEGGWRYGFPVTNTSSDMSVTGWALMFLRSAKNAEFDIPKLHFDQGLKFVERCYEPDTSLHQKGVFRYRPLNEGETSHISLANTASAMLTLVLGGRENHAGIAVGARWFNAREYPSASQNNYFYLSSYYSSQAMAQVGGESWNNVFPQIARNLLQEQTDSGAWPPGVSSESRFGSGYSTPLAVLALTPAYQLLPIYQR